MHNGDHADVIAAVEIDCSRIGARSSAPAAAAKAESWHNALSRLHNIDSVRDSWGPSCPSSGIVCNSPRDLSPSQNKYLLGVRDNVTNVRARRLMEILASFSVRARERGYNVAVTLRYVHP